MEALARCPDAGLTRVVVLERANKVAQYNSYVRASLSGIWGPKQAHGEQARSQARVPQPFEHWLAVSTQWFAAARALPDRLLLRSEDFWADPNAGLARVREWCSVQAARCQLQALTALGAVVGRSPTTLVATLERLRQLSDLLPFLFHGSAGQRLNLNQTLLDLCAREAKQLKTKKESKKPNVFHSRSREAPRGAQSYHSRSSLSSILSRSSTFAFLKAKGQINRNETFQSTGVGGFGVSPNEIQALRFRGNISFCSKQNDFYFHLGAGGGGGGVGWLLFFCAGGCLT